MKVILELLFIGTLLITCGNSLTIRDFASNEWNDVEPDHTNYAAVARYVVHKSGEIRIFNAIKINFTKKIISTFFFML